MKLFKKYILEYSGAGLEFFLQQLFSGIAIGTAYACLALGLVIVFRISKMFNFAHGELSMLGIYFALWLLTIGTPYWVAFVLAFLAAFIVGGTLPRLFSPLLASKSTLTPTMMTIGIGLICQSLVSRLFPEDIQTFPSPFPEGARQLGFVDVSYHDIGLLAVTGSIMLAVAAFFRFTKFGLAMRAVPSNMSSSRLVGIPVTHVFAFGWGLAIATGTAAGMLMAPNILVSPTMMQMVIVYSYAGAILGGLDSELGAVIGSIIIGVLDSFLGTYVPFIGPSLKLSATLLLMLVFLLFKPQGIFGHAKFERV